MTVPTPPEPAADVRAVEPASPACEGSYHLFAPFPDACLAPIDTDRPHQTDTPHVVDPGHVQLESALVTLISERVAGVRRRTVAIADSSLRIGLVNRLDLQLFYEPYEFEAGQGTAGDTLTLRSKLQLLGTNRTPWTLTLVPVIVTPLSRERAFGAGGQLFFGAELPLELDWELNAGALDQRFPAGGRGVRPIFSSALTRDLWPFLAVFGEVSETGGDARLHVWNTFLDTGLLSHVTRDVQIDAAAYFGVSGQAPLLTTFVGLSLRR